MININLSDKEVLILSILSNRRRSMNPSQISIATKPYGYISRITIGKYLHLLKKKGLVIKIHGNRYKIEDYEKVLRILS